MTEHITIKLNKKVFGPLLEALEKNGKCDFNSMSELVGCNTFFAYEFVTRKIGNTGKTGLEIVLESAGQERSKTFLEFKGRYHKYVKEKLGEK